MKKMELLGSIKETFTGKLSEIETEKKGVQETLDKVNALSTELEAEDKKNEEALVAAKAQGFEEGLAQAGQAGNAGKIYSAAELDAELAPLQAEIETLKSDKAQMSEELGKIKTQMQAQTESHAAELEASKAEGAKALADFKAEALTKFDEAQSAENMGEAGYKEFLSK